jgi:hypothetical protein
MFGFVDLTHTSGGDEIDYAEPTSQDFTWCQSFWGICAGAPRIDKCRAG